MKRFGMMPLLMASSAMSPLRREGEEAAKGEEGAGTVTQDGGTTRFTPPTDTTGKEAPPPPADPNRPAAWPEGVNSWEEFGKLSPEDQAKGYAPKEPVQTEQAEEPTGIDAIVKQTTEGMAPEMAEKATPFIKAFAETGTLTDEQVTQAAKDMGLSEAMVRQYMAGGEAQLAAQTKAFTDLVGGEENWPGFQEWAGTALNPEQHKAINDALEAGKPSDVQKFVDQWKEAGHGPAPRQLERKNPADGGSSGAAQGYASLAEQKAAQSDPRYRNDDAFRADVIRKIAASNY